MNGSSWEKTALHFDLISSLVPLCVSEARSPLIASMKRSVKRDGTAAPLVRPRICVLPLILIEVHMWRAWSRRPKAGLKHSNGL